jgi:hypothetical protein
MNARHDSCLISALALSLSLLDSPYRQFLRETFGLFSHVLHLYWLIVLSLSPYVSISGLSGASVGFPLGSDFFVVCCWDLLLLLLHHQPRFRSLMSHLKGEDRRSSLISILIPLSFLHYFSLGSFSLPNAVLILLLDTWHETFYAPCPGGHFPPSPSALVGMGNEDISLYPRVPLWFSFSHALSHMGNWKTLFNSEISPVPDRIRTSPQKSPLFSFVDGLAGKKL